jgi:hypothetical protein
MGPSNPRRARTTSRSSLRTRLLAPSTLSPTLPVLQRGRSPHPERGFRHAIQPRIVCRLLWRPTTPRAKGHPGNNHHGRAHRVHVRSGRSDPRSAQRTHVFYRVHCLMMVMTAAKLSVHFCSSRSAARASGRGGSAAPRAVLRSWGHDCGSREPRHTLVNRGRRLSTGGPARGGPIRTLETVDGVPSPEGSVHSPSDGLTS